MKSLVSVLALSLSLSCFSATKAEMKLAIDASDLEEITSVKVAPDQLAMAGTLTLDLRGSNANGDYLAQRIIIYDGESPSVKEKFPVQDLGYDDSVVFKDEPDGYDVGESGLHPNECVLNPDSMTEQEYLEKCTAR